MKIIEGAKWGADAQDYYIPSRDGELVLGLEYHFFRVYRTTTRPHSEVLLQISLAFLKGETGYD